MKKAFTIALMLICLLVLVGCDPGTRELDKEELLANTVRIELVNYENENPELINLRWEKQKPRFDFNKATFVAALEESRFEELINEIGERHYAIYSTALNEPMGKTLVLYQKNGNMFVLFGCPYTNEQGKTRYYGDCYIFDENGVLVKHIGDVGHLFGDWVAATYFADTP